MKSLLVVIVFHTKYKSNDVTNFFDVTSTKNARRKIKLNSIHVKQKLVQQFTMANVNI